MTSRFLSSCVVGLGIAVLGGTSSFAADSASDRATSKQPAASGSATRSTSSRPAAKGTLPDPVLLDGSNQPVEKRPEHGMIGDFELPGDENVRSAKVGGPQGPQGQQQQNGQQQGMMAGMPSGGGGGEQGQQGQQQQGGAQQQGQDSGNAPSGPQDPNAKAEGMQVAQLETDPNAGGQGGADPGQKPPPVAIGDKAMQIKSVPNPNVVGSQQQQSTAQQMEKQVGGGKGSTPVSGGRNAAEKGRAIPAGL